MDEAATACFKAAAKAFNKFLEEKITDDASYK